MAAKPADETLAVALDARDKAGVRYWRRIGDLRRVVSALPKNQIGAAGSYHVHTVLVCVCKQWAIRRHSLSSFSADRPGVFERDEERLV